MTPVYFSTMIEHGEYILTLCLCTWVFLLKCFVIHLFPLNFIFLIQKHFFELVKVGFNFSLAVKSTVYLSLNCCNYHTL